MVYWKEDIRPAGHPARRVPVLTAIIVDLGRPGNAPCKGGHPMKKISRRWARAVILLCALGAVLMLVGQWWETTWMVGAGGGCLIAALLIKFSLRCPNCGWRGVPPQWFKDGTIHCPKCGAPLEYDR